MGLPFYMPTPEEQEAASRARFDGLVGGPYQLPQEYDFGQAIGPSPGLAPREVMAAQQPAPMSQDFAPMPTPSKPPVERNRAIAPTLYTASDKKEDAVVNATTEKADPFKPKSIEEAYGLAPSKSEKWANFATDLLTPALAVIARREGGAPALEQMNANIARDAAEHDKARQLRLGLLKDDELLGAYNQTPLDSASYQKELYNNLAARQAENKKPEAIRGFESYLGYTPDQRALWDDYKGKSGDDFSKYIAMENLRIRDAAARNADEVRRAEAARHAEEFQDKQINKLGDSVGNIGTAHKAMNELEKSLGFRLDDYDPKTKTVNGKSVDLPGLRTGIPGIGNISFYSDAAKRIEDTATTLFNLQLHDRSGVAVTTPEMERLQQEWSRGAFRTQDAQLDAMKRYYDSMKDEYTRREAAFSPNVVKEFKNRGGTTSADFKKQDPRSQLVNNSQGDVETTRKQIIEALEAQGISYGK